MREPTLNHKLQAAREQKIWTLEEAAEEVGIDAQTFWRWENYVQWPRPYSLRKLCEIFGRSAEELGFGRLPKDVDPLRWAGVATSDGATEVGEMPPTSQGAHANGSLLVRLLPEQAALLLSLLHDETAVETIMNRFDPARRATLRELLATGRRLLAVDVALTGVRYVDLELWESLSAAPAKPSALNSATVARFERYLGDCWELSNQNELETAEGILSSFLPRILAFSPRDVTSKIAYLASQGLRLQSILAHHRFKVSNKVLLCRQAVDYAWHADDPDTLVTALIELAAAFKFEGQFDKRLSTLQEALGSSVHASPLVQSRAYSNSASALAESGRVQEAQLYIKLARDVFPADPAGDPGSALADSSIFTLSYHAGKVYAAAGNITEAFDAFDLYRQHSPGVAIPERIRLEIVNAQSKAALQAKDLARYASFLESALVGALALGSKKRFDEAVTIFRREMPKTWREHSRIRDIAEKYSLEREG